MHFCFALLLPFPTPCLSLRMQYAIEQSMYCSRGGNIIHSAKRKEVSFQEEGFLLRFVNKIFFDLLSSPAGILDLEQDSIKSEGKAIATLFPFDVSLSLSCLVPLSVPSDYDASYQLDDF